MNGERLVASDSIEPWFIGLTEIALAAFIVFIVILWIFSGKCPQCHHYFALKKTGAIRREDGMIFVSTSDQYRCTHCGDTDWLRRFSGYGGG